MWWRNPVVVCMLAACVLAAAVPAAHGANCMSGISCGNMCAPMGGRCISGQCYDPSGTKVMCYAPMVAEFGPGPMQPMPPMGGLPPMGAMTEGGMTASASAVSNGPGQSSSWSSNINGVQNGGTHTRGSGVATSTTSGPSGSCTVMNQATSGGCQGGPCCSLTQKVERCRGYSTAVASINGNNAHCCITLLKQSNKSPQLFCASPYPGKNYLQMPSNVQIELKPSCKAGLNGAGGTLACTVTFHKGLPKGYTYPAGYSSRQPLSLWADKAFPGFKPCNAGGKFRRMIQAVSRVRPVVSLTSKCE